MENVEQIIRENLRICQNEKNAAQERITKEGIEYSKTKSQTEVLIWVGQQNEESFEELFRNTHLRYEEELKKQMTVQCRLLREIQELDQGVSKAKAELEKKRLENQYKLEL